MRTAIFEKAGLVKVEEVKSQLCKQPMMLLLKLSEHVFAVLIFGRMPMAIVKNLIQLMMVMRH